MQAEIKEVGVPNRKENVMEKYSSRNSVLGITLAILAGFFFSVFSSDLCMADNYPNKPVTLIVPHPAGGSTDISARLFANYIQPYVGQPIVVVNRGGGGGLIAESEVINAKPDGYTLMMAVIGPMTIYPAIHRKAPFSYKDFLPVAMTEAAPCVVAVREDLGLKNLKTFVDYLKKNPKKLRFAIAGAGTISELGIKIFLSESGIPLKDTIGIPCQGTADAVVNVLGGHQDYLYANLSPLVSHIRGGKLVPLAVTTKNRLPSFPEVPTFEELGYKDVSLLGWKGVVGPKKLPPEVIKYWEDAVKKMTSDKGYIDAQEKVGSIPNYQNAEDFSKFLDKEFSVFRKIATEQNLLVD
jgi:tripartite-type tricarboxylate transporter receptor subunit TctC